MDLADRLLEAHVSYQVRELQGPDFAPLVAQEVAHFLDQARLITLGQAVHRQQVKDVAAKYVATFRLPGSIPEIAVEIATRLRTHSANETALGSILPRRHVVAMVEQVAGMEALRDRVALAIGDSPSVQLWLGEFLHGLGADAVGSARRAVELLPGAAPVLSTAGRVAGGALHEADRRSREVAERAAGVILNQWRGAVGSGPAAEELTTAVLEIWDAAAERPIGELLAVIDDDELADVIILGYEIWQEIRTGEYLHALVDSGVDYVFDTYDDYTLAAMLVEFGLGQDDLVEEALRFAPRAISAMAEAGVLENLVRRRLEGFYGSPEARAVLEGPGDVGGQPLIQ